MKLRFSRDALADLDELRIWLQPLAPRGYSSVLKRVTNAIRTVREHPESGRATAITDIREIVETRYGFVIPYRVLDDTLWVLRVYNAKRYPLNYNALPDPRE